MLELNWRDIYAEEEKIAQLQDEQEQKTRYYLLEAIQESINDYNAHVSEFAYAQQREQLKARGLVFVPIPQEQVKVIEAKWSKIFAAAVPAAEKQRVQFKHYRWHLFSYNILPAAHKEAAREAFDKCAKQRVYMFFQLKDEAYAIENAQLLKSTDFDLDTDVYIFDAVRHWTYIHTHEEQCGPYFYDVK